MGWLRDVAAVFVYVAVFVNSCARVFPKFVTCAKTCAKLARTRRTPRFPNTCKSVVPRLCANLHLTCSAEPGVLPRAR